MTTTMVVRIGWRSINQRAGVFRIRIAARAISNAQPTCKDGIAANSFAAFAIPNEYGSGPKTFAVSINPYETINLGGINGNSKWMIRPENVARQSDALTCGIHSIFLTMTHTKKTIMDGKCITK